MARVWEQDHLASLLQRSRKGPPFAVRNVIPAPPEDRQVHAQGALPTVGKDAPHRLHMDIDVTLVLRPVEDETTLFEDLADAILGPRESTPPLAAELRPAS